jgi:hypothetical protein
MAVQTCLSRVMTRATLTCVFGGAAALLSIGCASAPTGARSHTPPSLAGTASRSSVLSADEIARVPTASTALDAVRQLRPLFLRVRPGAFYARGRRPVISVYVEEMYAGNLDALQTIPADAIQSMRYLDRTEALAFANSAVPGDAFIMVSLKNFARRR